MRDGEVNLKTTWAIAFIAIAINICAAQTPIDVPDNTPDDIAKAEAMGSESTSHDPADRTNEMEQSGLLPRATE